MTYKLGPEYKNRAGSWEIGFQAEGSDSAKVLRYEDLLEPDIKPVSLALIGGFFTTESPREPMVGIE